MAVTENRTLCMGVASSEMYWAAKQHMCVADAEHSCTLGQAGKMNEDDCKCDRGYL